MSRQSRAGEPGQPLAFRGTRAEQERWRRAATTEGCASLSAWIVLALNERAQLLVSKKPRSSRKSPR